MSKRQIKTFFAVTVIVLSIFGIFISDSSSKSSSPFKAPALTEEPEQTTTDEQVIGSLDSEISVFPSNTQDSPNKDETVRENTEESSGYRVLKIVDGDTIDVDINGVKERLRLIGIDTPETVDPRKAVQCFGKEASNKAKEILTGQFVNLESDESQGERDKYGRLLRYVFLPDGTNFNLFMIEEGYAHEYTYHLPYKYQAEFKQAEIDARENSKGLWNPTVCPQ